MGMPFEQSANAELIGAATVKPTAEAPTKAVLESKWPSSRRLFFDMYSPGILRSLIRTYGLWFYLHQTSHTSTKLQ